MKLSPASAALFSDLAATSALECRAPTIDYTVQNRGNLTDLKKKGLIKTEESDGDVWVYFLLAGVALAKTEYGTDVDPDAIIHR